MGFSPLILYANRVRNLYWILFLARFATRAKLSHRPVVQLGTVGIALSVLTSHYRAAQYLTLVVRSDQFRHHRGPIESILLARALLWYTPLEQRSLFNIIAASASMTKSWKAMR